MAEIKTKPTRASVENHIAQRASEKQRPDCDALMKLFRKITKSVPYMYGPTIVGFGTYHYKYESGHEGDAPLAAFAIRGSDLVAYVTPDAPGQKALLAKLGKHKMGKSCIYFKRLSDLDVGVLEQLVRDSIAEVRRRYG